MDLKKAIRKIVALGMGATMLGSMGALAQTTEDATMTSEATSLNMYPDKFVTDGVYNGYLVAGGHPEDTLAIAEVSSHIYYKTEGTTEATTTTEVDLDDAFKIKTSANALEIREELDDILSAIDKDDLDVLADYDVSGKDTSTVSQTIYLGRGDVRYVEDTDRDKVGYFLRHATDALIGKIELDFSPSWKSDYDTTNKCEDYRFRTLKILGKEYDVVKTDNTTNGVKLTLMTGAVQKTLNEGEETTVLVNGKTYKVKLTGVFKAASSSDNDKISLTINGETLNDMKESDTKQLADGTNIGISVINVQDYAGGIKQATFYVGADKVVLENNTDIELNGESKSNSVAYITSTVSSTECQIDLIQINVTSDDEYFTAEGEFLSENEFFDYKERLMGLDYYFGGFEDVDMYEISLDAVSNTRYQLSFTNMNGDECALPVAYVDTDDNTIGLGEAEDKILRLDPAGTLANGKIRRKDYFLFNTKNSSTQSSEAETYAFQYSSGAKNTSNTDYVKLKPLCKTGETTVDLKEEATFGYFKETSYKGTEFRVQNASDYTASNYNITLNSPTHSYYFDSSDNTTYADIRAKGNLRIRIDANITVPTNVTAAGINLSFKSDDTDLFDNKLLADYSSGEDIGSFVLKYDTNDRVKASDKSTASNTLVSDPDDTDKAYWSSRYGALVEYRTPSGSPQEFVIKYPEKQLEPMVYLATATTTTTAKSAPSNFKVASVPVQRTLTPSEAMTMLDTELINMIVVGGPCANSVAAMLKNNPANCAEGFVPGQGYIESFKLMKGDEEAYALLIAGYSAADTRRTANIFATYYNYEDKFGTNTKLTVEAPESEGGDVQVTA